MSSTTITAAFGIALSVSALGAYAQTSHLTGASRQNIPNQGPQSAAGKSNIDPARLFQRGQEALAAGNLPGAENAFRQVLALDPKMGGAYANLGVVYMRQKHWDKALDMFHKAERLLPEVPGIRLNIGLAYYRQNEFLKAMPPFESVIKDQPDSLQARYLLGQCYFFAERWPDAVNTLEPLWPQSSSQLDYLYVLMIAAHESGRKDLDQKAFNQLVTIGGNSPELHLFLGKAHLNRDEYDLALSEFQAAEQANPTFPFVHFNLGLTYTKKQDYERAREQFRKDAEIEPDLALNYEELGNVYWLTQRDADAENSYRQALKRDPRLVKSWIGLAKIYQGRQNYNQALASLDAAEKIDPERSDLHYVRGQVLLHMGRKEEAQKELDAARANQARRSVVPSPELTKDRQ